MDVNTAIELDDQRHRADDLMTELMKDDEVQKLLARKVIDMGLRDRLLKDGEIG